MSKIATSTHASKSNATQSTVAEQEVSAPPAPPPLEARVTGALALVQQALAMLDVVSPPLSPAQVKAATKFRKGGEAQIPALARLSATYAVEVPSRATADMKANLEEAQLLAPLLGLLVRFVAIVESASFQVRSEAWATATTLYQMLRKGAVRSPSLKTELAPLEEFFSYRHPLVKETAPTTAAVEAKDAKREANAARRLARLQAAVSEETTTRK